jgi:hypothetical protein
MMRRALQSRLLLLSAILIGGPVPTLPAAAPDDPLTAWKYPGSVVLGGGGGEGQNSVERSAQRQAWLVSDDDFDVVARYYEQKFKVSSGRSAGSGVGKSGVGTTVVLEGPRERPVATRIFVRNSARRSVTVVITRARTEAKTHIAWTCFEHD